MTGTTISHYRILEKLGGGGMGVVYRAEDTALHRFVALKFLAAPNAGASIGRRTPLQDSAAFARFQREARAAAALNHPNICTIYEVGEHEGQIFIAMELVEGETLASKLKAGPLGLENAAAIAWQVAEGLEEAHEHNIVHRDLKPANVMVTPKGRAKILDFGLAKLIAPIDQDALTEEDLLLSRSGAVKGTVPYMSPEQLRGDLVDARTDIYAFGALLYEMTTGRRPFLETQTAQLIAAILATPPPAPRDIDRYVPPEWEAIIMKALAKDPAERYQSVQEILAEMPPPGHGLGASGLRELSEARRSLTAKRARRLMSRPAIFAGVGLAAAVVAILLWWALPVLRRHASTQPGGGAGAPPVGKQLAVLPFSVIGGGANEQAFSRGLADTLTAKLTQISAGRSLQVVPVGDLVAQHIETAQDAARVFRVNLVLTGSLESAGNRVRVTYALVNPATDRQLSASTLTVAASNPFAIEDKVVEGTAVMLGLAVEPVERQTMESHGTLAASAFRDYLQGLGYLQNYESLENLSRAVKSFRAALKADSTYALAYAGLGQAFWRQYELTRDTGWVDQAQQSCGQAVTLNPMLPASHLCLGVLESGTGQYSKALSEFQKVLEIEPTNIEAFGGLGAAEIHLKKIADAEATFRQAISVRPNYWGPYNWLGVLDVQIGENEKALGMFRKVIALAPGNHMGYYNLGAADYMLGKWPEAEEMFKKSIAIHPSAAAYSNLGTVLFYQGRFEEAAADFEKAVRFTPKDPQLWGNLADAYKWSRDEQAKARPTYQKAAELARQGLAVNARSYALLGELAMYEAQSSDFRQALADAQRALELAPKDPAFLYNIAIVFDLAGQPRKALDYLGQAVKSGYPAAAFRADPEWSGFKNNREFQDLLAIRRP